MLYALGTSAPRFHDPEDAWVAPDAAVVGDVEIAAGVGIWFGAVLRGDRERIEVGANSNIQDLSVLHTDPGFPLVVGQGCTIGHRAILHGCTIGPNSLVGMGAVILNGARIGANCLVGAGALVPEGREVPDGSLVVGMPARVVRALSAEEIANNRASAAHYVSNWRMFRAELVPVGDAGRR